MERTNPTRLVVGITGATGTIFGVRQSLATESYGIGAQGAAISSGSFVTLGMVIAPCSMLLDRKRSSAETE